MLESLSRKQKILFFIILAIMILFIIYYIYSTIYTNDFSFTQDDNILINSDIVENFSNTNTSSLNEIKTESIIVYICGEVNSSKVVSLKENSRIIDAIDAAGGLTDEADLTNINLAYILEDGEKIYIPKKGEVLEAEINNYYSHNNSNSNYSSSSIKNSKININKATQTELESIPGVGPSTALKILDYREKNGKFSSIEDIKNVSGIGNAKYEKMKDYISVK